MKVVILAAGYATRLYPLTLTRAKPLLPVAGKPMVVYVLDNLAPIGGLDRIYIVTNAKFTGHFQAWADDYRVHKAHLDFTILKRMTGRHELGLASEEEMSRLFPDCDLGAMPPFASLYGMPLYLDACFRSEPDVYFQAGNHHEVVRMRYADFERLAGPPAGVFCMHGALHVAHV